MKIRAGKIYHIYNQGNNRETIFFQQRNYIYFLRKVRNYFLSQVNILAYCLMPNHFHFLIYPKENFIPVEFSNNFKILLRSYTRGINKQESRSGSLFRQNSKAKPINEISYALTCFRYIHQNPVDGKLVANPEDWEFSSCRDYLRFRDGTLCNKELAFKLLRLPESRRDLYKFLTQEISQKDLEEIF